ncbi:dienelactone hydrolase family protein [Sporomusa malonica]|uniref:Dienelactone hydrolase n=1 Tax=Sporomusa malonica TaxID=112901 RepID=A0A1W2EIA8_9FIRM|nr:dienelactone hydrolase family protein [Sporomusa malonica]SMD09444.1 Dienelactone hydrolase [Sporomusa malonica]
MLIHDNKSDIVIVVLHEIYGVNNHIVSTCKQLSKYKVDVIAPNLLNDKEPFNYEQEEMAYSYFMNNIGFATATNQVKEVLYHARNNYKEVYVLGYSIGATLAWLCSETGLCDLIIGFYGSRIRSYLFIEPKCPCLLFFPTSEQSFNVDDLILDLSHVENVHIKKLDGHHGFADPFSRNYNKQSSIKACAEIKSFVKNRESHLISTLQPQC